MEENMEFYGFRGNIVFLDQVTLFSFDRENNSKSKNEIFRSFFEELKAKGKIHSKYQKRKYYLIYIDQYDDILHCQLARERFYDKYEMTKEKIVGTKDQDYPFINIFVELNSQKFLIESKTLVFENYITAGDVIKNIMSGYLKELDSTIDIYPITEEQEFWSFFSEENKVKKLNLSLTVPNLFDANDDATNFLNDSRDNVGASNVQLTFSNPEGKLNPNKKGINSYIKYISAGGGKWKLSYIGPSGKIKNVISNQISKKISISISKAEVNALGEEKVEIIRHEFSKIETIEKFKEE